MLYLCNRSGHKNEQLGLGGTVQGNGRVYRLPAHPVPLVAEKCTIVRLGHGALAQRCISACVDF